MSPRAAARAVQIGTLLNGSPPSRGTRRWRQIGNLQLPLLPRDMIRSPLFDVAEGGGPSRANRHSPERITAVSGDEAMASDRKPSASPSSSGHDTITSV